MLLWSSSKTTTDQHWLSEHTFGHTLIYTTGKNIFKVKEAYALF